MPREINGLTYYRTLETCRLASISRATLFRWLKSGILDKSIKDRRGWRLFSAEDIHKLRAEARRLEIEFVPRGGKSD